MSARLLRGRSRGCFQAIIIRVIAAVIVVPLACVCILGPLAIAQNAPSGDTATIILLAASTSLFFVAVVGAGAGIGGWVILSRARQLDAAFEPLGLKGRMYLLNGRQYHGGFEGYGVNIYFYRGPALDIYLKAAFKTRLAVGVKDRLGRALAGMAGKQPLPTMDPSLERLSVYADEPAWGAALLAHAGAREALARLMTESGSFEIRTVMIAPEHLLLRLEQTNTRHVTTDAVRQWLADLAALASAAQALPAPQAPVEATALESSDPGRRQRMVWIVGGITVLVLVGIPTCLAIGVTVLAMALQT